MTRHILAFALILILPSCGGGFPPIPWPPVPPDLEPYDCENPPALEGLIQAIDPVADRYIVVLKSPPPSRALTVQRALELFADDFDLQGVQPFGRITAFAATITDQDVLGKLLANERVAYIQQVGHKYATVEWNLDRIDQRTPDLDGVYDPVAHGPGVNVAIVDTGVSDHPDFTGRLQEPCFTAHTFGGCSDLHGHGTHVAGTVAGATFGVANEALLYAVRVLNEDGSGTDTDVIQGIEWVIEQKTEHGGDWVINMSLGGSPAPALDDATCRAINVGITVAVAAGNDGEDAYGSSPARVKQAITVGAMGEGDNVAYFSNHGPGLDLFAPGVGVKSAKPGGGSAIFDGTSMASPHVAGAAALVLGQVPGAPPGLVRDRIVEDATEGALSGVPAETPNVLLFVGKAQPPAECLPGVPWCHETTPPRTCSTEEAPCKHNPTANPDHCELAPECEPEPPDPPPPNPDCKLGTPTARELVWNNVRTEVRPEREGAKAFGATPFACFGQEYYCTEEMNWPEACGEGKRCGPVAPDGHPQRVACEKQFLELDCAHFSYESETHMSFDPFIAVLVDGERVNRNHQRNVEVCGQMTGLEPDYRDHPSWVKDDGGRIQSGEWAWATAHGNGRVCASAAHGIARKCVEYREP